MKSSPLRRSTTESTTIQSGCSTFTAISISQRPAVSRTCGTINFRIIWSTRSKSTGNGISSSCAASLSQIKDTQSELSNADLGATYLEQDMEYSSTAVNLFISDNIVGGNIIVQFNDERTMKTSFKEFQGQSGSNF